MKRFLTLTILAIVGLAACSEAPTSSGDAGQRPEFIVNGSPDGNAHPYVGWLLFDEGPGTAAWYCSGSALDANTILTAGHCTDGAVRAFYSPVEKPLLLPRPIRDNMIAGTPVTYPGFNFNTLPNTGDVGVVQLTGGTVPGPYARLAPLNGLNTLDKHQDFDIVGYGLERVQPVEIENIERMAAQTKLIQIKSGRGVFGPFNLKLASNGRGGTCFGDSGGPILVGNVVYAVNSYVWNSNCTNASYAFRVDQDGINQWLAARVAE
jgi:hypothetical protein